MDEKGSNAWGRHLGNVNVGDQEHCHYKKLIKEMKGKNLKGGGQNDRLL